MDKLAASDRNNLQFVQPLAEQITTIEQEARMVLPGIQAIFGFQLIAVFNQGFKASLTVTEQIVHLAATLLMSIAALLILAPAAYHRATSRRISVHFTKFANGCFGIAMAPMALGLCLDLYIIAKIVVHSVAISFAISMTMLTFYAALWFVYPKIRANEVKDLEVYKLKEETFVGRFPDPPAD